MQIWNELTLPAGKKTGYDKMVGITGASGKRYVPLEFWFCRNIGLALPLIALQYHEVKINIEFGTVTGNTFTNATLWADYIFLDTDERRRFAQLSHEYLIEQVQFTGEETLSASTGGSVKLSFNHPVKELIWEGNNGFTTKDIVELPNLCLMVMIVLLNANRNILLTFNHINIIPIFLQVALSMFILSH